MSITLTVNISKIEKNRFSNECALVSLSMSGEFSINNLDNQTYYLSEQKYQFPLPSQKLEDGTIINSCPSLLIDGDPSSQEIEFNCKIIARYWLNQLGISINENDIILNIIGN